MARPKKEVTEIEQTVTPEVKVEASGKIYAKVVHLAVGVDLLGSKTSLVAKKGLK